MQNTAQIDILKKVTHQTIKYFIDPNAICIARIEIYRYVIPVLWRRREKYLPLSFT